MDETIAADFALSLTVTDSTVKDVPVSSSGVRALNTCEVAIRSKKGCASPRKLTSEKEKCRALQLVMIHFIFM